MTKVKFNTEFSNQGSLPYGFFVCNTVLTAKAMEIATFQLEIVNAILQIITLLY